MGRIAYSTCVPDRFTGIIHNHYFFLPSITIVYSVHLSTGHTQHWYPVIAQHTGRRHCASDTDSHAVCPSSISLWTMSCASRRRVHQKTQRSEGRLTRTRQAYNLYWLSSRIWKMSSWTHSIPCLAFPSWKLIIWLPPAYCCGCAWKPEAAVFTCNNCLSLHHYITFFPHHWWSISLASYRCSIHFLFSTRDDFSYDSTFKVTRGQNFECFPTSMTVNVSILILVNFFHSLSFQKHKILAISPLWCPCTHEGDSAVCQLQRSGLMGFHRLYMYWLASGMK